MRRRRRETRSSNFGGSEKTVTGVRSDARKYFGTRRTSTILHAAVHTVNARRTLTEYIPAELRVRSAVASSSSSSSVGGRRSADGWSRVRRRMLARVLRGRDAAAVVDDVRAAAVVRAISVHASRPRPPSSPPPPTPKTRSDGAARAEGWPTPFVSGESKGWKTKNRRRETVRRHAPQPLLRVAAAADDDDDATVRPPTILGTSTSCGLYVQRPPPQILHTHTHTHTAIIVENNIYISKRTISKIAWIELYIYSQREKRRRIECWHQIWRKRTISTIKINLKSPIASKHAVSSGIRSYFQNYGKP